MKKITLSLLAVFSISTSSFAAADWNDRSALDALKCDVFEISFDPLQMKPKELVMLANRILKQGADFGFYIQDDSRFEINSIIFGHRNVNAENSSDSAFLSRFKEFINSLTEKYNSSRQDIRFGCNMYYPEPRPRISGSN